jgi:hypothetical protein
MDNDYQDRLREIRLAIGNANEIAPTDWAKEMLAYIDKKVNELQRGVSVHSQE